MTDLPPGWEWTTIGQVCEVVGGATPRTDVPEYWGGDVPWITPNDLARQKGRNVSHGERDLTAAGFASSATRMLPPGTVLYSSRAPIGYVAIASAPVCTNQGFKSLVVPTDVSSDYLYWYLTYATPVIQARASGTTFKEISTGGMEGVPLALPPKAEQQRIVAVIEEHLSRLDAAAAAGCSATRRLKTLVRVILSGAQCDGPKRDLGDLLLDIEAGKSFQTPGHPARSHEWGVIKVSAMTWGEFDQNENKVVPSDQSIDPRHEIRSGDLLLSRANTSEYVGASVLVRETRSGLLLSDKSMRLVTRDGVDRQWLRFALGSPQLRSQMSAMATGTSDSMRNLSQAKVRSLRIRVPRVDRQRELAGQIEAALAGCSRIESQVDAGDRKAAGLRRAVLAAAFSGRLVPQDPADEPASVLLERIAAERARTTVTRRRKAATS